VRIPIRITLVEHKPFALWGKDRLLSERGRLFPASGVTVPNGLPRLAGPDTRVAEVVALYNESRVLFAGSGNDVRALGLDRRGSWSLTLGDGAASAGTHVVVGRSDARPRLARFARLLPQLLAQQQRPLQRADLRYTNGFALNWATLPKPLPPLAGQGWDGGASVPTHSHPNPPPLRGGGSQQQGQT
jgi:cell division protein FtsQ